MANKESELLSTELNPALVAALSQGGRGGVTELNPAVYAESRRFAPQAGSLLADKYCVLEQLDAKTGEADLYLAEAEGNRYVVKLYRRETAIKPEVLSALERIDSPYVARIYASGVYNGFPYEILPYYERGSLAGMTFTFDEIKRDILPYVNEALRALHKEGVLHKDLKPSNIMLLSEGEGVALIDFGISSVVGEGNTVLLTRTGMTPEYSAPETFRGVYLEESDYYSLGITLYELYCGHTPYRHLSPEAITQYMAVQRVPYPEDMPLELKELISALTYHDLTARHERENPNRRWTFCEVDAYLKGEKLALPGQGVSGPLSDEIEPFDFANERFCTLSSLVKALGVNWREGKRVLFRGFLSAHFEKKRPILSRYCREAEEESVNSTLRDDLIYWRLLYRLYPELSGVYWQGRAYPSLSALGRDMLEKLWGKNKRDHALWDSILTEGLLSACLERAVTPNKALLEALTALEVAHRSDDEGERGKLVRYYLVAYLLSGHKVMTVDKHEFHSVASLAVYMRRLYEESYEKLKAFCQKTVGQNGELSAELEAWLIALGERDALNRLRAQLS